MSSLTILMPVYNEQRATVRAAIEDGLSTELPVARRELIVVDDGSTDGTRDFLASVEGGKKLTAVDGLRVLHTLVRRRI